MAKTELVVCQRSWEKEFALPLGSGVPIEIGPLFHPAEDGRVVAFDSFGDVAG